MQKLRYLGNSTVMHNNDSRELLNIMTPTLGACIDHKAVQDHHVCLVTASETLCTPSRAFSVSVLSLLATFWLKAFIFQG
jgi:hypothetical protein